MTYPSVSQGPDLTGYSLMSLSRLRQRQEAGVCQGALVILTCLRPAGSDRNSNCEGGRPSVSKIKCMLLSMSIQYWPDNGSIFETPSRVAVRLFYSLRHQLRHFAVELFLTGWLNLPR